MFRVLRADLMETTGKEVRDAAAAGLPDAIPGKGD